MGPYDDIMGLPRPVSKKHRPMALSARAAQFMPFAALVGYGDELAEADRLTEAQRELGDSDTQDLSGKLRFLLENASEHPSLTVTYFVPDSRKAGGQYVSVSGTLKKIREAEQELELQSGERIPISRIMAIE